jgi:hypothetical protein
MEPARLFVPHFRMCPPVLLAPSSRRDGPRSAKYEGCVDQRAYSFHEELLRGVMHLQHDFAERARVHYAWMQGGYSRRRIAPHFERYGAGRARIPNRGGVSGCAGPKPFWKALDGAPSR